MLKKILLGLLVIFIIVQFFRPEKNDGTIDPSKDFINVLQPPTEIAQDLKNACYDCHSNKTKYPWYSNINPISFWMADHIRHGKGHLNFSEWTSYNAKKQDHKLEEIIEETKSRHMPIKGYLITHKEARLSREQVERLVSWVESIRK